MVLFYLNFLLDLPLKNENSKTHNISIDDEVRRNISVCNLNRKRFLYIKFSF